MSTGIYLNNQELIKCRMGEICCGVANTFGGEIKLKYMCKIMIQLWFFVIAFLNFDGLVLVWYLGFNF